MAFRLVFDARRVRDFGIGTYIRSLLAGLGALDHDNHYQLIVDPKDADELPALPDNFATVPYRRKDSATFDHIAFPAFLRTLRADLYHIPLNRVPLLMLKPYVVTIHDMTTLYSDRSESSLRMAARRFRFERGLRRADCVVAVSDATAREVMKVMGLPANRIRRVYNAPDPKFFSHDEPEKRQKTLERYQIQYPFLLYAGSIRPHKNIPRLVEAFAVVRDQLASHPVYRDLRLIIIGDEISRYPSVRHAVVKSKVEPVVRFLGFVPFDTLRYFVDSAAAFVFPSRHEGFGLPPLEAMASGTPVVSSNVSSLPEVLGDAALMVSPENVFDIARGISQVLLDEDLRTRLIAAGHKQAARYSWDRTAREVLGIYRETAAGR
jgi:glycosyltransferase involved in cell wall biosynthesis